MKQEKHIYGFRIILHFPFFLIILFISFISFNSCKSTKHLEYFNDLPDSTTIHLPSMIPDDRVIQVGDQIQITIGAKDEDAAAIFNRYGGVLTSGISPGAVTTTTTQGELTGYLIDVFGNVEFPIIGKVKAEGLTSSMLKDTLTRLVAPYLKDPLVSVRFMTFKFTVLGEVRAPGIFNLPLQRTTILDALGAAGDLPLSAKRELEIYRDYNGKRVITKIDLRKKQLLYEPEAFLIKHNDVIYVKPRESRLFDEEARFYTSFFALAIGLVTLMVSVLKK